MAQGVTYSGEVMSCKSSNRTLNDGESQNFRRAWPSLTTGHFVLHVFDDVCIQFRKKPQLLLRQQIVQLPLSSLFVVGLRSDDRRSRGSFTGKPSVQHPTLVLWLDFRLYLFHRDCTEIPTTHPQRTKWKHLENPCFTT